VDFLNNENNQKLGEYLHNKRMDQHLDLEDISNKIAIPIQHLKKIEEGDFEDYDSFYLKMYLKKYATSLSVNIDELYKMFYDVEPTPQTENEVEVKKTVSSKPKHTKEKRMRTTNPNNKNIGKIIALICAGIVIIYGLVVIFDIATSMWNNDNGGNENLPPITNPHNQEQENEEESNEELTEELNEEENQPEEELPNTIITRVSHQNQTQTFDVITEVEEIEIILNFSGPCWIGTASGTTIGLASGAELTAAGITYAEGDTETITLTEAATLSFNIGNVQMLEMIINGETVEIETVGLSQQWIVLNIITETE